MRAARVCSLAIFTSLWMGYGLTAAEADTSHDHSEHTGMTTMEEMPEAVVHVAVDSAAQNQIDRLVGAYLMIAEQLAHDRLDSLAGPFEQMSMAVQMLSKNKKDNTDHVAMLAAQVAGSIPKETKDIKKVRASFEVLSAAVIALVEKAPPSHMAGHGINKAYCPMKSAAWLQQGADILNPYYGSEMLGCGSIKNAIEMVHHN